MNYFRKKRVIFFDGDGTLWYPERTKRSTAPHWIYNKHSSPKGYLPHLSLTPSIVRILSKLKKSGKILVAVSTHPHSLREANMHMAAKMVHFKIGYLFNHILTSRPYPSGKGRVLLSFLKKSKIPKTQALLIGDSYLYDYKSARGVGIDCLLIKTKYMNPAGSRVQKTISSLSQIIKWI